MANEADNEEFLKNLKNMTEEIESIDAQRKVLEDLDIFVLDNSLRETTVGQLRGHTLQNKWEIYNEVKRVGFKHRIVTSFTHMTRVGDTFIEQLHEKGEDMSTLYAFTELSDDVDNNKVPVDEVPIGLRKCKQLKIHNPIIEIDLAYSGFNYEDFNLEKICQLLDKRIQWIRKELSQDSKIYINFRDFSDAMAEAPDRLMGVVKYLSSYRPTIVGFLYEEFGSNFPQELAAYTRAVRNQMKQCGFDKGHLLIHIHHQWGLSDVGVLECLSNGANGIWAGICEEGAAMGHASSILTLMNLIRIGNCKVIRKFNCHALRSAAINITKIVTGNLPPPKTVVVGARAMDQIFGLPKFDPELMEGFSLQKFFDEKIVMRISTLADNKMVKKALEQYFGEDPQFTLEMGTKMKELMLEDLRNNRKEEYQSPCALAMLFDRAGGQMTEQMSETIAKIKVNNLHIQGLIDEIRARWNEWDLRDNNQIDDMLDFNAFYNGFMAPYFGCYRCDETRKALKAIDMDNDGVVDWNEFLVYLKWAGNAFPETETSEELLDIAFRQGLLPAMQDVLIEAAQNDESFNKKTSFGRMKDRLVSKFRKNGKSGA